MWFPSASFGIHEIACEDESRTFSSPLNFFLVAAKASGHVQSSHDVTDAAAGPRDTPELEGGSGLWQFQVGYSVQKKVPRFKNILPQSMMMADL